MFVVILWLYIYLFCCESYGSFIVSYSYGVGDEFMVPVGALG